MRRAPALRCALGGTPLTSVKAEASEVCELDGALEGDRDSVGMPVVDSVEDEAVGDSVEGEADVDGSKVGDNVEGDAVEDGDMEGEAVEDGDVDGTTVGDAVEGEAVEDGDMEGEAVEDGDVDGTTVGDAVEGEAVDDGDMEGEAVEDGDVDGTTVGDAVEGEAVEDGDMDGKPVVDSVEGELEGEAVKTATGQRLHDPVVVVNTGRFGVAGGMLSLAMLHTIASCAGKASWAALGSAHSSQSSPSGKA